MEKNYEIEIKEFKCPFCEQKEIVRTKDNIIQGDKKIAGFYIDYWECPNCGEENDIGLECFEEEFKIFKNFTETNDWFGLRNFCKNNKFDDFMLFSLAKYYIQKQEFEKSLNIAKILVEIDPKDISSEELIEKSKKGLDFLQKRNLSI